MIGRALKLTREFHQLTQLELAKRLQVSNSFISEIESGTKQPTLGLLEKYSVAFGIPASTFLVFVEEQIRPPTEKQKARAQKVLKFLEWVTAEQAEDGDGRFVRETKKTVRA